MNPRRSQSFEARARRRNRNAAARNAKKIAANPLFHEAGLLDQVGVRLETTDWTALAVAYDQIALGVERYQWRIEQQRRHEQSYVIYIQMLDEAITAENREEVVADYEERWRGHAPMQSMEYRLNYLNNYLARYLKRTSTDIFEEAKRRLESL